MKSFLPALLGGLTFSCHAVELMPMPAWTDAESALREMPTFGLVGEYLSTTDNTAFQSNQLEDGSFLVATYQGGLPGAGWDKSPVRSEKLTSEELKIRLQGCTKTERTSPTLDQKAPKGAILVFPDDFTNVKDGILLPGGKTKKNLGSFRMHLEFMQPFKPGRNPSSQDRGNSGIYIFDNYEIQVIDSFALDLDEANNAIPLESHSTQWCGALYKTRNPDIHMVYPPLTWQTYDIEFHAPVFENETKIKHARITVHHNGVLIHDNIELETGTGNGAKKKPLAEGPVFFQAHGNPVMFRNIWAVALE